MANNKNNGLFDKIKKTIDKESNAKVLPEIIETPAVIIQTPSIGQTEEQIQAKAEQRLLKRFNKEKLQLAEDLATKYKTESLKRIQQQEQKVKAKLLEEHQKLKAQYEQAAKDFIQKREKELLSKFKKQIATMEETSNSELTAKITKLQRILAGKKKELEKQNQLMQNSISEAKINARKEQEKASRALYEDLMQASHTEIIASIEKKYQAQLAAQQEEYQSQIARIQHENTQHYEAKIQAALMEQQAELLELHQQQLNKEKAHIYQLEADNNELQAAFELERCTLKETIERLHPEIEANKQTLRTEIEAILKAEFEEKIAEFKTTIDMSKQLDIEAALAIEKQRLAEAMQEENAIILKYKEREIREACDQTAMQAQQVMLKEALAKQEKNLIEAQQQHEKNLIETQQQQTSELIQKLQVEHEEKLQFTVMQERMRLIEQNTADNKALLQKQQQSMLEKFEQEKQTMHAQFETEKSIFLQQQQNIIRAQFENDKDNILEQQKLVLEKQFANEKRILIQQMNDQQSIMTTEQSLKLAQLQQELISKHQLELAMLQDKLQDKTQNAKPQLLASAPVETLGSKHIEILHNHEQTLRDQFAEELEQARSQWQSERQNLIKEHQRIQSQLRNELTNVKSLSEQQQTQLEAQFEEHDASLQAQFEARLKQQQTTLQQQHELLRGQFELQLQQQQKDMQAEMERLQQSLAIQHQEQLGKAISNNTMQIRAQYDEELAIVSQEIEEKYTLILEQERKKIQQQFAQDKAVMIKDLTERFNREKQITMEQYETELRDKLYKEMVKQKEYIQHKFTSTQQAALQEQKRRLEAEHKHEVERIKRGYFKPDLNRTVHDEIIVERSVEHLADRILSKFKSSDK